jgi:hypothetical protein
MSDVLCCDRAGTPLGSMPLPPGDIYHGQPLECALRNGRRVTLTVGQLFMTAEGVGLLVLWADDVSRDTLRLIPGWRDA